MRDSTRHALLQPLVLLFLALGLPLGMSLAVLVPLGQVADEPAHVLRADSLLHGEFIGHRRILTDAGGRKRLQAGVIADGALLSVIVSLPHANDVTPTRIDGAAFDRSQRARLGQVGFFELGTIAGYFPVFYVPAAATLAVCRVLRAGAYASFMAARFANLFASLLMGAAALAIARSGRVLLFAALLLPLSLSLAASVSQDGLLIAAAALAVACASVMEERPSGSPAWWTMTVLVGCIVLAKPPYLPLVVLLFLPFAPAGTWRLEEMSLRLAALGVILLLATTWSWLAVHSVAAPIFRAPEEAGPLWPGARPAIFDSTDMVAQLSVLTADPWRFLSLPLHSIQQHADIFPQMLSLLGWLNLRLPTTLVAAWKVALVCAALADMVGGRRSTMARSWLPDSMLLLAAVFVTVLLIYLSQYLSFTPVGWDWISGVQGRYLVPLLPLVALALPAGSSRPLLSRSLTVPAALAATAGLYVIPLTVVRFFYMG